MNSNRPFTMDDIALELGVSKSTVSRALADSKRISLETRRKVQECAKKHGFRPNLVARALACQKTLNLAAVMPSEATSFQMMFFHECLSGMVSRASQEGYSVLVCMVGTDDSSALENIVVQRKVDAVVLTQLKKNDRNVELLRREGIPFVVIGSGAGDEAVQVDSRMKESCSQFTQMCISKLQGEQKVLFVCGSLDVEANNNRLLGFFDGIEALADKNIKHAVCTQFADLNEEINLLDWNLILCSDDIVCSNVLSILQEKKIPVGKALKIASFHDSVLLESRSPSISALRVDAFSLGSEAASVAFRMISGSEYEKMNYVDCSFELRESTEAL